MNTSFTLFGENIIIQKSETPGERQSKRKRLETGSTLFKNLDNHQEKVNTPDPEILKRVECLKGQTNFSQQDLDDIYLHRDCFWIYVEDSRIIDEDDKTKQKNILERLIDHKQEQEIIQRFHRLPERLRCYLFSKKLWRLTNPHFSVENYSKFNLEALRKEDSTTALRVKNWMKEHLKNLIYRWEWETLSKYWEDQFFRNQYRQTIGREIKINENAQWNTDHSFNKKFNDEKVFWKEKMDLVGEKIDYLKVMKNRADTKEKRKIW